MTNAGMTTRIDPVGNLFGRYKGTDETSKTILSGSHLDAVPAGGRYDGAFGVVAACEAIQSIYEHYGPRPTPLEVVAFIAEESGPLGGTFGSRSMAGFVPTNLPQEALDWSGLTRNDILASKASEGKYGAFLELHIEQGPVLWSQNIPLGIPTGIVSINRYRISFFGEANHAGTTPMAHRDDSLRKATHFINQWYLWVENRLKQAQDFVSNIGSFSLRPNVPAVIPEQVEIILEIRAQESRVGVELKEQLQDLLHHTTPQGVLFETLIEKPPVLLDQNLIDLIGQTVKRQGLQSLIMPSGASHDASALSHIMPTGMIFVPSTKGISHNKAEFTPEENMAIGVQILAETIFELSRSPIIS